MNARNAMKSDSYGCLIERRQITVAEKNGRSSTISGIDAELVVGAFMHQEPVFSTAC
jgi:hypothetical protein